MLIDGNIIAKNLNFKITGALHIGAHECEEIPFYINDLGLNLNDIIWIDAMEDKINENKLKGIPNQYQAVISNIDDIDIEFNIANNGQSSSIFELGTHLIEHPHVFYNQKLKLKTKTIATFYEENKLDAKKYNFWNLDIQGAELLALKGSKDYLKYADAIYLEINEKELYKDCALFDELNLFLINNGFTLIIKDITKHGWGDALYCRIRHKLFINGYLHHKNYNALCKYKNIDIVDNINIADVIYSPGEYLPIHPEKICIYGPHFSVFPNNKFFNLLKEWKNNACYIMPSYWCIDLWANYMNNNIKSKMYALPFGVETDLFNEIKPLTNRNNVFIYIKNRDPNEINFICNFLNNQKISYNIFNYTIGYQEEDYLNYLQNSKYGIIINRHESQGFAIEEALSCNVPLLVWNVRSMKQEWGCNYDDYSATSIPYWDDNCGEYFHDAEELPEIFDKFMKKLEYYQPRNYILENLSIDKCNQKFVNLINKLKN
jgi:hypothetical protein